MMKYYGGVNCHQFRDFHDWFYRFTPLKMMAYSTTLRQQPPIPFPSRRRIRMRGA